MKMIEVEYPALDVYLEQVHSMSEKYLGDAMKWFSLRAEVITEEDDRDEFSFIRMALWDKLTELEEFDRRALGSAKSEQAVSSDSTGK